MGLLADIIAAIWNRFVARPKRAWRENGLDLGSVVVDGQPTKTHLALSPSRQAQHILIDGKTGVGKSSFILYLGEQAIRAFRSVVFLAVHRDIIPHILAIIAAMERATGQDFSERLIFIDLADPEFAVGINVLETADKAKLAQKAGEFSAILRNYWHLDHFGARTEELLRNALYVLAFLGYTLLELSPFLTQAGFRTSCLRKLPDCEAKQYFELRFDNLSEAMRRVMAEPILNKVSAFTGLLRHVIGHSTASFETALDQGKWIVINLDKAFQGEHAVALGGLFLVLIKNALFARNGRELVHIFLDEAQNFAVQGESLQTMFSELRKYQGAITASLQFLEQVPADLRAAMLAVGTLISFQVSSADAQQISTALDGGKSLVELLKNLPPRHMVVKSGHERWHEVVVPTLSRPDTDYSDLVYRSRTAWARSREAIDRQISERLKDIYGGRAKELLDEWE